MKILFTCGSAEPGNDGVGDYTRRLCGALIRNGHQVSILSLCDNQAKCFVEQIQVIEGTAVVVRRIPRTTLYRQRLSWTQEILQQEQPEWISLQFVPYSFNPKGLPFWLPSFLMNLKGNHKWHIMFHELWLGIDKESSFKHKYIGKLQQLIIKRLIQNTNTDFITTQLKLNQFFLQLHNITAQVLPICGNIPLTALKKEAKEFIQFALFGTIHNGAPFSDFVEDVLHSSNTFHKPIKFVFIGNNGPELVIFTRILLLNNICYEVMGIQSENVISQVLIDSDFGISTTPYFQTEKSGVYAAYREHQLNTICVAREWTPTKGKYDIPQIIKYEKNNLNISSMDVAVFDLVNMAKQFINFISSDRP